jgi:hypothetical protein
MAFLQRTLAVSKKGGLLVQRAGNHSLRLGADRKHREVFIIRATANEHRRVWMGDVTVN